MDELIISNKTDIVNIADAIRSQTGETEQMPITDIPMKIKTLSSIGSSLEPKEDDIPKVFFTGELPTTKDNVLAELTYISKTLTFHSYVKIKCQGTSSMKYPKKNFTVALYEDEARETKKKVAFKNWGEQNKFCLKANWIDISHARNVVSARLWGDVVKTRPNYEELPELLRNSPNQGAIDGFAIKVFYNGVYQGRYTWNIPKDAWMFNMDDELDNHCVLCGENYDSGCFRALAKIDESDWSDEIHDTCPESIKTRWNEVINFVMNSTDEEFKSNISNYFDFPSLIDYHLFGLAVCGSDSYGKNQIYMTYDGTKWIASMYDLDTTWGMYWNGETLVSADYARTKFEDYVNGRLGNLLYSRIEQNFATELTTRWSELKSGPLSLINIINRFERFMDIVPSELIKEDYASTTANGAFTGIPSVAKNNLQQIRNFAVARQAWTDNYIVNLSIIPIPCTGLSLNVSTLTFTGKGTQTLIATPEPNDTTDTIFWNSSNNNIITVDNGVVTAVGNGESTITATCGSFSATCAVSVSGIEDVTDPDNPNLVYKLPQATTFDGTNYIDIDYSPLATDSPFTILIDWTHTGESEFVGSRYVVMHCMTESNPYPGLILQYAPAGIVSEARQTANISSNSTSALIDNADLHNVRVVYRKAADGTMTISRCYNNNGQIHTNSKDIGYIAVPESIRLGCYRSNTNGTGRFAKGVMNDCLVYNTALSDEQIQEFLIH
ncbi:MAG: CotH kinase family protein [Clostridia bacterium]|nr:CotH kinase family protein [Clostridia bacterium]